MMNVSKSLLYFRNTVRALTTSTSTLTSTPTTQQCTASTSMSNRPIIPLSYIYLDNLPYKRSSELQQLLVERQQRLKAAREASTADDVNVTILNEDLMLLVEHTPTYTNGRRNKGTLGIDQSTLLGADYFESSRGGELTYHGPGQLVAYPILDLRQQQLTLRCYVSTLEKAIIATCDQFGVNAKTTENTGVWVDDQRKIAAIGVQYQRFITSHGLALNCNTDLNYFKQIVACGLKDKDTTSLAKVLGDPSLNVQRVVPAFLTSFGKTFHRSLVPLEQTNPDLHEAINHFVKTGVAQPLLQGPSRQ
ncbi:hypothetical protein SAMD00019534_020420, partial [Acytostelium subglobosum LB1]|uniref:hypothetical protein n=1 Tax=Acytostelium subglobosum LB1 TaxID=1410327 RepID=UPI000644EFC7